MSEDTRIINAISGKCISTNIRYFTSYNNLKDFINIKWGIPTEQILILLPYGTKLKQSTFESYLSFNNSELQTFYQGTNANNNTASSIFLQKEFYVYDRRLFSLVNKPTLTSDGGDHPASELTKETSSPSSDENLITNSRKIVKSIVSENILSTELALIRPVPSPLMETKFKGTDSKSYHNITTSLVTNIGWLSALEIDVHYLEQLIRDISDDILCIIKCLFMADQYLKKYTFDVEELYNSNVSFLKQLSGVKNDSKWIHYYSKILNNLKALNKNTMQQYVNKTKLDADFETIKELDSKVNSDLIDVKNDIDTNFSQRNIILKSIQNVEIRFTPSNDKYELEDEMLLKFTELMNDIKSESRSILDKKSEEFSIEDIENIVTNIIETNHKSTVSKLYIISQALYTKVEDFLLLKHSLQEQTVIILGQISFSQIEILKMKKILLNSCNTNLKIYQDTLKQFTQVEDIPFIYGLYMIELYRRNLWLLRVLNDLKSFIRGLSVQTDKEKSARDDWASLYGLVASLFTDNVTGINDFTELKKMIISNQFLSDIENVIIPKHQNETKRILQTLNDYLQKLTGLDIISDVHIVLRKKLQEVNYLSATLSENIMESFRNPEDRIKYYRNRVMKLESVLHDTYINNSQHWPTGIISSPFHMYGPSNTELPSTSINELPIVISTEPESKKNVSSSSKEEIDKLRKVEQDQKREINKQNLKLTDLQLETNACRETLNHLNKELFRLTTLREEFEKDSIEKALEYKEGIQKLVEQNVVYSNQVASLKNELTCIKEEHEVTIRRQATASEQWDLERQKLQKEIEELKQGKNESEEHSASEHMDRDICNVSVQASGCEQNIGTQTDAWEIPESVVNTELQLQNKNLQNIIFQMFQRNIYILENIGLLLVSKDEDMTNNDDSSATDRLSSENFSIKRVKGLKKSMDKSFSNRSSMVLDDNSTTIPDKAIQSSVYRSVQKFYQDTQNNGNIVLGKEALDFLKRIYDNGLYESSVIRRFNDVELLAKKMTKEVKSKKLLLDRFQAEKITVKDFQLGDTALFLPTSDGHTLDHGYSISSLNSSFSSIDISTPPPVRNSEDKSNLGTLTKISDKTLLEERKKVRPWAAFTAFEKDIKYFYSNKEHQGNLRDEEWFIGKITDMEKYFVTDDSFNNAKENPYKLSRGTVWYQVKATIIAHPTLE
ncbi:similar to Saccharomyces cerevisiae YPR049C ATG11 Adapter protein for pexophagy and the cytoplasm-to-vacuole targeting (Cvt) pathway [Maudiozyma saulgeensis]|uniref:Autophagy-related protein 11 n=1 Tax=Maudiozyma saulgeensis TaxID=1789683 RepID=A0A1X7R3W9_9SACH|nr:similar to Saccharomyces cerevisiae YPR049C ATG11 Adapter protein for pexophagy and the cytoplasm-to-vacuole targeting (Cvt) pathway [Kazachstania saulgeensis]